MSIQKLTFEGVLNYLSTKAGQRWNMVFQASQFELNDFSDSVQFGHLTLNLSPNATRDMLLSDTHIYFKIRKHGIPQEMFIPYTALMIIQDPDDPAASMPWPYFLDHGEDYSDEPELDTPSNVVYLPNSDIKVELRIPTMEDVAKHLASDIGTRRDNVIAFPSGEPESTALKDLSGKLPDLVRRSGVIDILAMAGKSERLAIGEHKPTLAERMAKSNMTVIIGGGIKVEASMPFIDEVYRAKLAKRDAAQKRADEALFKERALPEGTTLGELLQSPGMTIRSDGSKGKSSFFPDLDVSKCYFPVRRIKRPEWLQVHEGGQK